MHNFDEEYTVTKLVDGRLQEVKVSRNERAERPAEERTFVIGGESFVYRPSVPPEGYRKWTAMVGGEYVMRDDRGKPILDPETQTPISTLTEQDALEILDATVLAFLEDGQEEKWKAVRASTGPAALTLEDVRALIRWLFTEQTGRPTGRSSGSSNGSRTTGTGTHSTDASSLPAGAA